ncbi:fungal-specific transcription factor domain-containing protein [Cadophora sp. MPI-SDFR-AT-0126]|nr:fungal-specific transcription factor domain-containing protein [Leotiomycetes sp. MPI-SDFR-AT-0126]
MDSGSPPPPPPSPPISDYAPGTSISIQNPPTSSRYAAKTFNPARLAGSPSPPPAPPKSTSGTATRGRPRKTTANTYVCKYCSAIFQRQEHLNRHASAHEQRRPHRCEACGKGFSRGDVLNRHRRSCKLARAANFQFEPKAPTPRRACQECREAKSKCTGSPRCERCIAIGARCAFGNVGERYTSTTPLSSNEDRVVDSGPQRSSAASGTSPLVAFSDEPFGLQSSCEGYDDVALARTDIRSEENTNNSQRQQHPHEGSTNQISQTHPQYDLNGMMLGHTPESFADASFQLDQFDFMMFRTMFDDPLEGENFEVAGNFVGSFLDVENSQGTIPGSQSADLTTNSPEISQNLPNGLNISQLDPLEGHRSVIFNFFQTSGTGKQQHYDFLSCERMRVFLRSYFSHFHHHTPLLHLPTWSMAASSTPLIFAMVLIGAKYSQNPSIQDSVSRELCDVASNLIWSSYQTESTEESYRISLEDLQALYLLGLLDTCYFPNKRPTGFDFRRLVDFARAGGYFEEISDLVEIPSIEWRDWAYQESRRRTAFTIYLLDAMRTVFFGERPNLNAYDVRLRLPCHENVFRATDSTDWKNAMAYCADLTTFQFPIVISSLLSVTATDCLGLYSVMGSFIVLHGILVFIWERQQFDNRSRGVGQAESVVIQQLAKENNDVADHALNSWKSNWNTTASNSLSSMSSGLYRDRAIAYWFLGRLLNSEEKKQIQLVTGKRLKVWSMRIPRIMKHLIIKLDRGQLDESENIRDLRAKYLDNNLVGELDDAQGEEGMDLLNIRFIMNSKS